MASYLKKKQFALTFSGTGIFIAELSDLVFSAQKKLSCLHPTYYGKNSRFRNVKTVTDDWIDRFETWADIARIDWSEVSRTVLEFCGVPEKEIAAYFKKRACENE